MNLTANPVTILSKNCCYLIVSKRTSPVPNAVAGHSAGSSLSLVWQEPKKRLKTLIPAAVIAPVTTAAPAHKEENYDHYQS